MKSQTRVMMVALVALLLIAPAAGPTLAQSQAESPALILGEMDPLREIILPRLIPIIVMDVSSSLGDATLINRLHFVLLTAMVDAAAPYHPSAVGIYSRFERQPAVLATQRNINIAMLYAAYEALTELLPRREAVWREMLRDYGLEPGCSGRLEQPRRHRARGRQSRHRRTLARRHEPGWQLCRHHRLPPGQQRL